jgi:hypothetical protein
MCVFFSRFAVEMFIGYLSGVERWVLLEECERCWALLLERNAGHNCPDSHPDDCNSAHHVKAHQYIGDKITEVMPYDAASCRGEKVYRLYVSCNDDMIWKCINKTT